MFVVKDRVKQGTTTQGTGNVTVSTSYGGFQNFSVLGNGSKTFYAIEESTNWEVGIGTYNSNVISRDTILASSSGAGNPIYLSGAAIIFVTYPADNSVFTTGNIASITGVKLGASGLSFNDGTVQTTSAVSFSATSGALITTIQSTGVATSSNLASTGTTNAAAITSAQSRISTIESSGLATTANLASTGATNAAAASTNSTNITSVGNRVTAIEGSGVATSASVTSVSNRVSTIEGSGVALESDLTSAENRISTIEGSGLATTANLASTGATNAASIVTVGGRVTTIEGSGVALTGSVVSLASSGVGYSNRITTIEGSGVATSSSVTAVSNRVTTIEGSGLATAANLAATGATNAAAIDSIVAFSPASGAKVDLNTTNITSTGDTLKAQLIATGNDLEAQIGAATVPTATGLKIDNNSSSITTIQGSGVALTGSVVSLASSGVGYSNRITTIEGSGVATSSSVTAVGNRVTTIEGSGVALESDLTSAENRITTIEGSGVATSSSVTAVGNRVTTIEGSGVALSGSVESLASSGITGPIMVSGSPNLVQSFDLSQGNFHTVLMTGNMTGIIPHNAVAKQSFAIRFVQDNTGSRTMTNWFTNGAGVIHTTKFAGGSAFTLTTTANKSDVFGFICDTSGTYEAFIIGQNV